MQIYGAKRLGRLATSSPLSPLIASAMGYLYGSRLASSCTLWDDNKLKHRNGSKPAFVHS